MNAKLKLWHQALLLASCISTVKSPARPSISLSPRGVRGENLRVYTSICFFLCSTHVLENTVSKGLCACAKTWITCWSWSVLLATDTNSTILHFDSINKPNLSWPCGPVAVQSLTQSPSKILWDPFFGLFACYYALCFFRNQHTYPKSFIIVWSNMLHQNILTIHFFVSSPVRKYM